MLWLIWQLCSPDWLYQPAAELCVLFLLMLLCNVTDYAMSTIMQCHLLYNVTYYAMSPIMQCHLLWLYVIQLIQVQLIYQKLKFLKTQTLYDLLVLLLMNQLRDALYPHHLHRLRDQLVLRLYTGPAAPFLPH